MHQDLLLALNDVQDPELEIGIVDLGLIYRADWNDEGIRVELTMTSLSCPFRHQLVDQVKRILHDRFGEATSIRVRLVWSPPWSMARISEKGRRQLKWTRDPKVIAQRSRPRSGWVCGFWKH